MIQNATGPDFPRQEGPAQPHNDSKHTAKYERPRGLSFSGSIVATLLESLVKFESVTRERYCVVSCNLTFAPARRVAERLLGFRVEPDHDRVLVVPEAAARRELGNAIFDAVPETSRVAVMIDADGVESVNFVLPAWLDA